MNRLPPELKLMLLCCAAKLPLPPPSSPTFPLAIANRSFQEVYTSNKRLLLQAQLDVNLRDNWDACYVLAHSKRARAPSKELASERQLEIGALSTRLCQEVELCDMMRVHRRVCRTAISVLSEATRNPNPSASLASNALLEFTSAAYAHFVDQSRVVDETEITGPAALSQLTEVTKIDADSRFWSGLFRIVETFRGLEDVIKMVYAEYMGRVTVTWAALEFLDHADCEVLDKYLSTDYEGKVALVFGTLPPEVMKDRFRVDWDESDSDF